MIPDPAIQWALANSDPANLIALGFVYWELRREHTEVRDKIDTVRDAVASEHPERL